MSGAPARCGGLVGGAAGAPCAALGCARCGAPVLHLDGVALLAPPGADLRALQDGDPLTWLAQGAFEPEARAYACACAWTTVVGPPAAPDAARAPWSCRGHDHAGVQPRVRPWAEVVPAAARAHLCAGRWLVADTVYEGRPGGGGWQRGWGDAAEGELAPEALNALVAKLGAASPRWLARQLAPPGWTDRPLYAAFVQGWRHGDLDSEALAGTFADVPSLLAGLRRLAQARAPGEGLSRLVVAGVLRREGYVSRLDHPEPSR